MNIDPNDPRIRRMSEGISFPVDRRSTSDGVYVSVSVGPVHMGFTDTENVEETDPARFGHALHSLMESAWIDLERARIVAGR